jgi:4-amino-4-deoxy-L-arabinose transferase-like glycosyltransferase
MRGIKITKNPFLLFLPFLLLYIVMVLILPTHGTTGDENRYLMYAQNLLHGFYSPPAPRIDIGQGPGYPILLMPFLAIGLPLVCITIMNAVLYYLSIILLFKALQRVASFKIALLFSLFWACYYNSYENILLALPETFVAFLVSLLAFSLVAAYDPADPKKAKKYMYISGFIIGYIALTKIIFGYVILFMLIGSGLLWILNRKNANYRKVVLIFLIALTTTAPFLIYTYHMTNKIFYWGTTGGENLYWMSSPVEGETGSWTQYPYDPIFKKITIAGSEESIRINHENELNEIFKYKGPEKDDAYTKVAIKNIKEHPLKFGRNWISNIGRILFNYPYSYTLQKNTTLFRLPLTGIIVVLMLFCILPTFINWRKIIFPIRFILFFVLLYLGGSTFASAETRMFTVVVPMLLFWIGYVIQKSIKINMTGWVNGPRE